MHRITMVMLFIVLATLILYYGRPLLVPLTLAAMLSMLLLPVVRRLEGWGLGRILPIVTGLLLLFSAAVVVVGTLSAQLVAFAREVPTLQQRLGERLMQLHDWISRLTGLTPDEQLHYVRQWANQLLGLAQNVATSVLSATTATLVFAGLQVVFIFLFLYYRAHLRQFILMLLPDRHHRDANYVIDKTSQIMQRYVAGVFIVVLILSVCNTILFQVAGVPHALMFGLLAGFLNIIPYLGIWIGTALPLVTVAVLEDSLTPLLIIVAGVWLIQLLENNLLTPRITGAKVSLNPLATILTLIAGGMLWGIAGMVLFIPMLGIAKIVFDTVDALRPFGFLIGDEPNRQGPIQPRWWQQLFRSGRGSKR